MNVDSVKLSIVAPVYGVEKYIGLWLDSVFHQDIPETDYEVICVNDCTQDRSAEVIRAYQTNHSNLRLINHEYNKKDNAARNTGLKAAVGKYIWFNDPDDLIVTNCLKHIIETCEQNDLDSYHWSIQNTCGKILKQLKDTNVLTGPQIILSEWKDNNIDITYTWNRVYRRQLLVDAEVYFREERGCDVLQTIQANNICKRVMDTSKIFYVYREDNPTNYSHTDTNKAWRIMAYSFRLGKYVYELPNIDNSIQELVHNMGDWRINQVQKAILRMPHTELKQLFTMLQAEPEIYNFALQHSNRFVKCLLTFPYICRMLNYIYRPIAELRTLWLSV